MRKEFTPEEEKQMEALKKDIDADRELLDILQAHLDELQGQLWTIKTGFGVGDVISFKDSLYPSESERVGLVVQMGWHPVVLLQRKDGKFISTKTVISVNSQVTVVKKGESR